MLCVIKAVGKCLAESVLVLQIRDRMSSEPYKFLIMVLTPFARAVAFVIGQTYSLFFGWYDKRLAREAMSQLQRELERNLSFFLSARNAQIMPMREIKSLKDIDWPTIDVRVEGLVLKFVRWRDELQVYLAPDRMPNDWIELSLLLNLIEMPEKIVRQPNYSMSEVADWLKSYLDAIKAAYSPNRYKELKERLAKTQNDDRVVAKQWEIEINRRLYSDK